MTVDEIMTRTVLTIGPEASLRDVARVLLEQSISGLPVCGDRRQVLGVISEGDLIYKDFDPTERPDGPLAWLVDGTSSRAVAKARAATAGGAMSAPAITVGPDASVEEAARLMVERRVTRLPVVSDGALVGIATRADLMRALIRPDEEIAADVRAALTAGPPGSEAPLADVGVEVERGRVRLSGHAATSRGARLLERRARRIPGVIAVTSELTWPVDEARRQAMAG
jgi:CBS domain-containing protein